MSKKEVRVIPSASAFKAFAEELGAETPAGAVQHLASELSVLIGLLHAIAAIAEQSGMGNANAFDVEELGEKLYGMRDLIADGVSRAQSLHGAVMALDDPYATADEVTS